MVNIMMLDTCRLKLVVLLIAVSHVSGIPDATSQGESAGGGHAEIWLAEKGNPWAFPAPAPDAYSEPGRRNQLAPRFITPEEMNSIYKKHDEDKQAAHPRAPLNNYYPPGARFDTLLPGTGYPGMNGGMYSPYGSSPYISPFNYNNVAPFIY